MIKIEAKNFKKKRKRMTKADKEFGLYMQIAFAKHLDAIRKKAPDFMIQRKYRDIYNPRILYRRQKPKSGRITVRTAKMRYLLKYNTDDSGWTGYGKVLYKKQTPALQEIVRNNAVNKVRNREFEGRINIRVTSIPYKVAWRGRVRKLANGRSDFSQWMPKENRKTIEERFKHERKGRPLLAKSHKKLKNDFKQDIRRALLLAYGRTKI